MHAWNGVDLRHDRLAIRQEENDVLVQIFKALLLVHEHLLLLREHPLQDLLLLLQDLLLLQEPRVLLHDLLQGLRAAEACLAALDALVCDGHWRCRGGVLELLDVLTPTDADPTRARHPFVHLHVGAPTSAATDKAVFALADAYRLRDPGHVDAIERVSTNDARRLVGWLAFPCPVEATAWGFDIRFLPVSGDLEVIRDRLLGDVGSRHRFHFLQNFKLGVVRDPKQFPLPPSGKAAT